MTITAMAWGRGAGCVLAAVALAAAPFAAGSSLARRVEAYVKAGEGRPAFMLQLAAYDGAYDVVTELLDRFGNRVHGNALQPVLRAASGDGEVAIVRRVLSMGASPGGEWKDAPPLAQAAITCKAPELIDLLLDAGADLNGIGDDAPLRFAIVKCHPACARALLRRGASVYVPCELAEMNCVRPMILLAPRCPELVGDLVDATFAR